MARTKTRSASFVEQAAILAAASLFVRFIGFMYRLPLTGLIGDEGNAYYAAGYNIYTFVLIMSSAGLPAAISKMVSERMALKQYRNAHLVFRTSMYVALALGGAGALFLAAGAGWLAQVSGYPEAVYAIRTLSPTVLIVAVMAVYRGYFQGMRNTIPTALSQVMEQIFNAVFSVWLAYLFYDAAHVEYASAGGTAGTGIGAAAGLLTIVGIYALAAPMVKKQVSQDRDKSKYENTDKLAVEIIRTALPIIIGTAIFSIANFIDMTTVSARLTASGAFTEAEIRVLYGQLTGKYVVLTTLPVSISTAIATAAIPSIAGSQVVMDRVAVKSKINAALRLSMLISIPAAVGIGVLSDPILLLLFPKYSGGGLLLKYGVVSIIFLALAQIVTGVLQGIGRVKAPLVGAFVGTVIKIPLNYVLIADPKINVIGAVISTCACYLVASAFDLFFLRKYTKITPDFIGVFVKPFFASAVMGLGSYVSYYVFMLLSGHNSISVLVSVVIGILLYLSFMVLIRGFRREDLMTLPMGARIVRMLKL